MEPELRTTQRTTSTEEPSPARDAKWVSRILGWSVSQVYAKSLSGEIPAFKPKGTRTVRFIEDEILAYREQSRVHPRPTLKSITPQNTVLPCDDDDCKIEAVRRCG